MLATVRVICSAFPGIAFNCLGLLGQVFLALCVLQAGKFLGPSLKALKHSNYGAEQGTGASPFSLERVHSPHFQEQLPAFQGRMNSYRSFYGLKGTENQKSKSRSHELFTFSWTADRNPLENFDSQIPKHSTAIHSLYIIDQLW